MFLILIVKVSYIIVYKDDDITFLIIQCGPFIVIKVEIQVHKLLETLRSSTTWISYLNNYKWSTR